MRNRASSSLVGAVAGPRLVTESAAAAFAVRAAAISAAPAASAAMKTPLWVSPAPLVSTTRTRNPGTCTTPAPGRPMQEVARQAIREYVEGHSRAELLDRVLDEELPRYAEALARLGQ